MAMVIDSCVTGGRYQHKGLKCHVQLITFHSQDCIKDNVEEMLFDVRPNTETSPNGNGWTDHSEASTSESFATAAATKARISEAC